MFAAPGHHFLPHLRLARRHRPAVLQEDCCHQGLGRGDAAVILPGLLRHRAAGCSSCTEALPGGCQDCTCGAGKCGWSWPLAKQDVCMRPIVHMQQQHLPKNKVEECGCTAVSLDCLANRPCMQLKVTLHPGLRCFYMNSDDHAVLVHLSQLACRLTGTWAGLARCCLQGLLSSSVILLGMPAWSAAYGLNIKTPAAHICKHPWPSQQMAAAVAMADHLCAVQCSYTGIFVCTTAAACCRSLAN